MTASTLCGGWDCRVGCERCECDGGADDRIGETDRDGDGGRGASGHDGRHAGRDADCAGNQKYPDQRPRLHEIDLPGPGVAGSPDQITDSPGSYGTFSMNGARGRSNNFLLDGTDDERWLPQRSGDERAGRVRDPATILPVDSVAELGDVEFRSRVWPQCGSGDQHRHQERHEQISRVGAGVLAQQCVGRAELFQ